MHSYVIMHNSLRETFVRDDDDDIITQKSLI